MEIAVPLICILLMVGIYVIASGCLKSGGAENAPKVLPAIAIALSALVAYVIVYLLSYLIIGRALLLLSRIPLVSTLLRYLFLVRGDSPRVLTIVASCLLSFEAATFVADRFANHENTSALALLIVGSLLVLTQVAFMIANIANGTAIVANIVNIITGLIIAANAKAVLSAA